MAFVLGVFICACVFVFFLFSENGSRLLLPKVIKYFSKDAKLTVGHIQGHIGVGFKIDNLEVNDFENLPMGSVVRIQTFEISNPVWDIDSGKITLQNARVMLPNADPIILDGKYHGGVLDFSLFSQSIDLKQVAEILGIEKIYLPSYDDIKNLDFHIQGSMDVPIISGNFFVEKLIYKDFTLRNAKVTVNLKLSKFSDEFTLAGEIVVEEGKLLIKNTEINLQKSTFFIKPDLPSTSFFIEGKSRVDGTEIQVILKGTKDKPDLQLSSEDDISKDKLLLMLATGKSWKGLDTAIDKKQVSSDLVKDFVDYFVFAGSGDRLARKMGIKNIFVNLEKEKKGIGVKKQLLDNVDVGYEVNEMGAATSPKSLQQKISGDVSVTNKVSVSMEKELKVKDGTSQVLQDKPEDNKVLIKYKTKF